LLLEGLCRFAHDVQLSNRRVHQAHAAAREAQLRHATVLLAALGQNDAVANQRPQVATERIRWRDPCSHESHHGNRAYLAVLRTNLKEYVEVVKRLYERQETLLKRPPLVQILHACAIRSITVPRVMRMPLASGARCLPYAVGHCLTSGKG